MMSEDCKKLQKNLILNLIVWKWATEVTDHLLYKEMYTTVNYYIHMLVVRTCLHYEVTCYIQYGVDISLSFTGRV